MSNNTRSRISFDLRPTRFSKKIVISSIFLIFSGAFITTLNKVQTIKEGLKQEMVTIQVLFIFLGQYINLIIFYMKLIFVKTTRWTHFNKYKNRALMSGKSFHFSTYRIGLASILNCISSTLYFYAYYFLRPTVFQMILGSVVIYTPLLSRIFLKKKLYKHTIIGILLSIIAFGLICGFSFMLDKSTDQPDYDFRTILTAIGLMLIGLLFTSIQRVYEEYLLKNIETSVYRFIGLEGLFGVFLFAIIHTFVFGLVNYVNHTHLFDIGSTLIFLSRNPNLIFTSVLLIGCHFLHELNGIIITKYVSATFRVVTDVLKVILVWFAEIFIYDIESGIKNKYYYALFTFLFLFIYMLLIFGNILINELMKISICGLNKNFGRYNEESLDDSFEHEEYALVQT